MPILFPLMVWTPGENSPVLILGRKELGLVE